MKALSVRQPWAWAIIYALKNVENRGWPITAISVNTGVESSS
jgi:hypothetical protein